MGSSKSSGYLCFQLVVARIHESSHPGHFSPSKRALRNQKLELWALKILIQSPMSEIRTKYPESVPGVYYVISDCIECDWSISNKTFYKKN